MQYQTEAHSRWMVIYPCYISDSVKSRQGRKVPLSHACKDPQAKELMVVAEHLGFKCVLEPTKRHPKDYWTFGRVRVNFYADDGDGDGKKIPRIAEYANKKALLMKLGEMIPQLASRQEASKPSSSGNQNRRNKKKKKRRK